MSFLKTAALILLSIVLVVSLTVAVFASSVQILLYPDVYEKTLENSGAYDEIDRQLAGHIPINVGPAIRNLVKDLLGNFLAYMRSDTNRLNLTVSAGTIRRIVITGISELPVCAGNHTFSTDMIEGNITCRPPGVDPAQIVNISLAGQDMPSIDLAQMVESKGLSDARNIIAIFRNVLNIVLLVVLASLFLIISITRHYVRSLLQWVGSNLVIVGVLALASLIAKGVLLEMIPQGTIPDVALSVASGLLGAVFERIALYGGVLLGAGILMILFSFTLSKKIEHVQKKVSPKFLEIIR